VEVRVHSSKVAVLVRRGSEPLTSMSAPVPQLAVTARDLPSFVRAHSSRPGVTPNSTVFQPVPLQNWANLKDLDA